MNEDELTNQIEGTIENETPSPTRKGPGSSFINSPDIGDFWGSILNDDFVEDQPLINKQVEDAIESNPKVAEGVSGPIETEVKQLNDSNPNNDEVKNEAIEQTPIEEKQEILDNQADFESFINSVEQSERTPEDDKVDAYLQNYNKLPSWQQKEIERIHRSKVKDWAKGRDAKFNNAMNGVNESDYKDFLRKQAKYNDLYNLDNFDEDIYKARGGVNLEDEDAVKYYTDKFGQEWVDRQKNFRKNRDVANQNEQLAKLLWKYKQHNNLTDPITGKPLTEKQMLKDIANGDFSSLQGLYKTDRQGNSRLPRTYKEREALNGAMDRIKANLKDLGKSNEDFIEKYPEASLEEFRDPEMREEAKQIVKDDNGANDEVNNAKVSSIDWDKVHVYEPNEDPYLKVSDESDWINNPDYEPSSDEMPEDEDFLGPDEYIDENGNIQVDPNWKPENADEDFVGPDEQLDVYRGGLPEEFYAEPVYDTGLPAEIKYEPFYDTSDYNFDWDAVIETLPPDVQQELNEDLSEEDKEEISKLLQRLLTSGSDEDIGGSGVGAVTQAPTTPEDRRRSVGGSFGGFKPIMSSLGLGYSSGSVAGSTPTQPKQQETTRNLSSGRSNLLDRGADSGSAIKAGSVGANSSSGNKTFNGGLFGSGSTQKSSKLSKGSVRLPSGGGHTAPAGGGKLAKGKETLSGRKSTGDLNIDKLISMIVSDSKSWPVNKKGNKDSEDRFAPFKLQITEENQILVMGSGLRGAHFETAVQKNPELLKAIKAYFAG